MPLAQTQLLGFLIAAGFVLCLVPIVGGFLYYRRDRLLTHTERLKALEMGRTYPDDPYAARLKAVYGSNDQPADTPGGTRSLANQCYTTSGSVAGAGFFFAFMASSPSMAGTSYAIAAAAGAIGVTGMICGTILAGWSLSVTSESARLAAGAAPKVRYDPEAV